MNAWEYQMKSVRKIYPEPSSSSWDVTTLAMNLLCRHVPDHEHDDNIPRVWRGGIPQQFSFLAYCPQHGHVCRFRCCFNGVSLAVNFQLDVSKREFLAP
jgi:hypothetical protein